MEYNESIVANLRQWARKETCCSPQSSTAKKKLLLDSALNLENLHKENKDYKEENKRSRKGFEFHAGMSEQRYWEIKELNEQVSTLSQVIEDIAKELKCSADNEVILTEISKLNKKAENSRRQTKYDIRIFNRMHKITNRATTNLADAREENTALNDLLAVARKDLDFAEEKAGKYKRLLQWIMYQGGRITPDIRNKIKETLA